MNKHLVWLQKNRRKVNINLLEEECCIPANTVSKWLNGERPLPIKHHAGIIEWIRKFRED